MLTWVSDNLRDNLITLAVCVGVLALVGIVHLIKQHKEKQEMEKSKQKQQKQGKNEGAENITELHINSMKW